MRPLLVTIVAGGVLSLGLVQAGPADTNVLEAARARYQKAVADATHEWEEGMQQFPKKYVKLLDMMRNGLRAKSDLDGIMAVEKEKTLFEVSRTLPDTDEGVSPVVVDLRQKCRQQIRLLSNKCNQAIVARTRDYTNELARLIRVFVQTDRIDLAIGARTELNGVVESPRYKDAVTALALAAPTGTDVSGPEAGAGIPAAEAPKCAALDALVVPTVRFTEGQNNYQKAQAVNDFIAAVYGGGIRVRLSANSLPIESVQYASGIPRYYARYNPGATDGSRRARTYALEQCSAREALQALCASLNLGYRVDSASGEIVLVDSTSPEAQWLADNTPLDWLVKDMQNNETRSRHVGRTVLMSGEVVGASQGMNELTIQCANRLQFRTPKKAAAAAAFLDAAQKHEAAVRRNRNSGSPYYRSFVEVSAIGEIGKDVMPGSVVVENARLLEAYVGSDYVSRDERSPIRLGDPSSGSNPRRIHRIGE